jgi:stage II sporulation protein D
VETDCNQVLLRGRGYGHGVGFCQEGAMRMAELDYTYEAIINFYYRDVRFITSEALGFIKDP